MIRTVLAALVAFGCAYAASACADANPGSEAFAARCEKCHAETGFATVILGRRLGKERAVLAKRTDLAPEFIRHAVRNGIVSMPALTRVEVTDEELEAIARYLTRARNPSGDTR